MEAQQDVVAVVVGGVAGAAAQHGGCRGDARQTRGGEGEVWSQGPACVSERARGLGFEFLSVGRGGWGQHMAHSAAADASFFIQSAL